MMLEIGCGDRPTPGYVHNDLFYGGDNSLDTYAFGQMAAKDIDYEDNTLDEVIAIGVMEHMTYADFHATLANVYRMLKPGTWFWFDVPDIETWCSYVANPLSPFPQEHVMCTLYGWQRFPGDEHKSGWTLETVKKACNDAGFKEFMNLTKNPYVFIQHGLERRRMTRWSADAHIYVVAVKPL
jgi:predicted SAM-dependent methyltransferase